MLCGHKSRFAKICQAHKPPSTKSNGKKPLRCTGSSAAVCMNVTSKTQRSHSSSDQTLPDCSCFHVSFSTEFSFCWTPDAVRLFKPPYALPGKKKSTASYKQNKSYTRLKCEDCFDSWLFHGLGCSWLTGFSVKIKLEFFLSIIYLHIYFTWSDHVRGN